MKYKTYSHQTSISDNEKIKEVIEIIEKTEKKPENITLTKLRGIVLRNLTSKGWSSNVMLSDSSKITITAMKSRIAICLQTGNVCRSYADLLKLQYLFQHKKISGGLYILPTKFYACRFGSNHANFERLKNELKLFEEIITVPLLVIGFE